MPFFGWNIIEDRFVTLSVPVRIFSSSHWHQSDRHRSLLVHLHNPKFLKMLIIVIFLFFFFWDYFWGIYSSILWDHTGCALIFGGRCIFPLRLCSAKGPPDCPNRESNPGPTEWQAGVLAIELCFTPNREILRKPKADISCLHLMGHL